MCEKPKTTQSFLLTCTALANADIMGQISELLNQEFKSQDAILMRSENPLYQKAIELLRSNVELIANTHNVDLDSVMIDLTVAVNKLKPDSSYKELEDMINDEEEEEVNGRIPFDMALYQLGNYDLVCRSPTYTPEKVERMVFTERKNYPIRLHYSWCKTIKPSVAYLSEQGFLNIGYENTLDLFMIRKNG